MQLIIAIFTALLISGCSAVFSTTPVGETPTNISAEQDEWEGTWIDDDGSAGLVTVIDGTNGILKVDWVEQDKGKVERVSVSMYLRDSGDWTFASFLEEDSEKEEYIWARIIRKKRQAILWSPDVKKFKTLVEEGVLPGTVDGNDVTLGTLSSNHMEVIMSDGLLLDWEDPLVMRKSGE
jgi:uncharacterized protein YceK